MKKLIPFLFLLISVSTNGQTRFWGTAVQGGTLVAGQNWGCLYSTDNNGNGQVMQHEFGMNIIAKRPTYNNLIQATNGMLYGMTQTGGMNDLGLLYEYNPATNEYVTKVSFSGTLNGAGPEGGLFQASNGLIYGMTRKGGVNDLGIIFEYDPSTNILVKTFDFNGGLAGSEPWGGFMQASNGKLYAMTSLGGIGGKGDLFEYDPSTNVLTPRAHFTGPNGASPLADLVEASNGNLYALTKGGGTVNAGILTEYNIAANTLSSLYQFSYPTGCYPVGNLIEASDGNLYGVLEQGGTVNNGTICKYSFTTGFSIVYTFPYPGSLGSPSGGLVEAPNGKLYGMIKGGVGVSGAVFSYDPATTVYTQLVSFNVLNGHDPQAKLILASDGMMYGVTKTGGITGNQGNLFQYDYVNNILTNKLDFSHLSQGQSPSNGVIKSLNGKFYGTTPIGTTTGLGILYEYDPVADTMITKVSFTGTATGNGVQQEMIEATNLKLYGTAAGGGTTGYGVLFEYDPYTGVYLKKHDFGGTYGSYPSGAVVQANNGKLYGMANTTTTLSGNVRIYEYDILTSTFVVKLSSSGAANGLTPCNGMVQALNGKLYGMTRTGGASSMGVIFEYDIASNVYTKKIDFNGVLKGEQPTGSLILASNGRLYGLATSGGTASFGTLFEYDPATNTFIKKIDFTTAEGAYPWGTLMQASNGKLYGTTLQGGAFGFGTLFEFDPVTGLLVNKLDFNGTNGKSNGWKAHLIEATSTPADNAYFHYTINTHCHAGTDPTPVITGLAGGSFSSSPAGLSINPSTGTINLAASTPGVYGVSYLTSGPFPNTHTVYVSITSTPVAGFSYSSADYCPVGTTPVPTLTGVAGTFSSSPAGLSFVSTINGQVNLATSTPGTYFVTNTISSTSGCPAIYSSDTILIKPKPIVTISPPGHNVCSGGLVTESFSSTVPGTTYVWTASAFNVAGSSSGSGSGFSQTLTNTTGSGGTVSYQVTPTASGCVGATQNCNILVDDTISIFVNSPSVCPGQTANLAAYSTGGLATTYSWSAGPTVTGPGTATVSPLTTTTYTLTGTKLTCSDTAFSTVTVNPALVVSVSSPSVCSGSTATLIATSTGGSGSYTYVWSAGTTVTGTNTAAVSPLTNTTYTVTGTSATCSGTAVSTVTVDAPISVSVNSPSVCMGNSVALIGSSTGGGSTTTYTWSTGATVTGTNTANVSPTTNTTYTVTGANLSCVDSAISTVSVDDSISISVNSATICLGQTAILNNSSVGGGSTTTYTWSAGPAFIGLDMSSVTPTASATYTLTGTNLSCVDTAIATITVDSCNVWPGDTDNNFIVDNTDLLPIGLYYGASGSARALVSNSWQEYPAVIWGANQVNGFDYKHVDSNGDGVADLNDTLAINLNYSLSHTLVPHEQQEVRATVPDLYFLTSGGPYNAGDWVTVDVCAGTAAFPVPSIYGLAFDISYDASLVQSGSEGILYPPSWFGVLGTNAISLSKVDAVASTVHGALTLILHSWSGGYGKFAEFKFQTSTAIATASVLHFSISGYSANDETGLPLSFNMLADSITVLPLTTGVSNSEKTDLVMNIYPNPFTDQTTVALNKEFKNAYLIISDVLGKELRTAPVNGKQVVIEKGELKSGVYLIKIISEKEVIGIRKIIIH